MAEGTANRSGDYIYLIRCRAIDPQCLARAVSAHNLPPHNFHTICGVNIKANESHDDYWKRARELAAELNNAEKAVIQKAKKGK